MYSKYLLDIIYLYQDEEPRHKVQIYDLKGSWTPNNRNTAFSLYDGYVKAQTVKKNLAADALKAFKVDSSQTPSVCNLEVAMQSVV